ANHAQAVGLVLVARELGEELVVADPRARGESGLGPDPLADNLGDARCRADAQQVLGHVEIGLVEAQRLDVRGELAKDRADLLRDRGVDVEPGLAEDQVGAQSPGRQRGHRRAHAELARLVARGRNHAASARPADRHRLAAQLGIVALLDAGEERIHVDMDDLAQAERGFLVVIHGRNLDNPSSRRKPGPHATRAALVGRGPGFRRDDEGCVAVQRGSTARAMTIPGVPHDKKSLGQRELVVMVALLMSLNALAIDAMLPALDEMAHELGAAEGNRRQLVVAIYLLANGIGCLVPGAFADRFGRRPLLLLSLAAYALFSLLIALVHDFGVLLALRAAQGVL